MSSGKQRFSGSAVRLGDLHKTGTMWGFRLLASPSGRGSTLLYRDEERARSAHQQIASALTASIPSDQIDSNADDLRSLPPAPVSLRQWIHTLLEEGQLESLIGRLMEGFLVLLIIANVIAVALETIPFIDIRYHGFFVSFEQLSLVIYSAEYIVRLWSCVEDPRVAAKGAVRGRILFALQPLMVVDFLAFAPSILGFFFGIDLRVLRIFRLFRLLKLARYSQALQALLGVFFSERSALLASTILLLAVTCLAGEVMHLAEGSVQPKTLGTMPGAMYWALTTLTTLGYGDITPQTALGKFIAGVTMVAGVALFALPVGIIANGFVTGLSRRRFAITWTMLRRQPLFRGFDIDSLTDVLEAPTASVIREHAQVTVAGRDANEFYLIVSGHARAELSEEDHELGPGDVFGEEALQHCQKYRATVTAETDMRIMAFHGDELRRLCRKYPVLRQRIEGLNRNATEPFHDVGPAKRVIELESDNRRLESAVARLTLDNLRLRDKCTEM